MGVVFVQPVAIRSAVFSVVCSFCIWVSAMSGCQAGCAQVKIGRMNRLHTRVMSSYNVVVRSADVQVSLCFVLTLGFSFSQEIFRSRKTGKNSL